ncbi:MAG: ABC transporter permease [Fusobacteriota bacterium]
MKFWEIIKLAFKSLGSNKVRSILTMLGIIIGISSVIIISTVGKGSQQSITGDLVALSDKTITISVESEEDLSQRDYINYEDIENIEEIKNITGITPSMRTIVRLKTLNSDRPRYSRMSATGIEFENLEGAKMLYGRQITTEELAKASRVILIDDIYAMRRFERIDVAGETLEVESRRGGSQEFMIIGVYENPMKSLMGSFGNEVYLPYIPYTTFQKYYEDSEIISSLKVSVTDINVKEKVTGEIIKYLENAHKKRGIYEPGADFSPASSFNDILRTLSLLLTAVGGISLLVGGIGVMNIMLVSVTERIREIGIRKALGAQKSDIMYQFIVEAITLTLLGGIIGLLLGMFISEIIGMFIGIKPILDYKMIAISLLVSGGIGILFGTYPAKKASELNPIDALRHE